MLEFLLMLLGLAFPNSNTNARVANNNDHIITAVQTANNPDGDTGGNTGQTPPKP